LKDGREKIMDIDDFIFTDDMAESLGSRGEAADSDALSAESGEAGLRSGKAALAALSGVGLGILSFFEFDR
jgi:hypothetical protein